MKQLIKKFYPKAGIHFKYLKEFVSHGTLSPSKITLPNGNILFANWNEPRGRGLILNRSTGQPHIKEFWVKSIQAIQPNICIDIGANYGEVIFSINYPSCVKFILGIEANPQLNDYLQKSRHIHHNGEKIEILNVLAGDSFSEGVDFYIDKSSSGRSTALKNSFVKDSLTVKVKSIRVDEYIIGKCQIDALVFKIDVEGFESFVLNGMTKIISLKKPIIGCIEFNLTALVKNNINVNDYLEFLKSYFIVAVLNRDNTIQELDNVTIDEISLYVKNEHVETDLLLFDSNETLLKYTNSK